MIHHMRGCNFPPPLAGSAGAEVERRLLALMNSCHGSSVVESPRVKVQMAEEMWQALQDKGRL
jgi:hypothetical protein